ncbi:hypothetical protein WME89_01560 [Sorangium sp. So ce321]|uniref:hypothetical protein n=1 Tax=Sorangium sp. So ce321 TaxID=3133300 RepID=UPI003F5ED9F0
MRCHPAARGPAPAPGSAPAHGIALADPSRIDATALGFPTAPGLERGLTIDDLSGGCHDVEVWLEVFGGQATSPTARVNDVGVLDGLDTLVEVNFLSSEIDPRRAVGHVRRWPRCPSPDA